LALQVAADLIGDALLDAVRRGHERIGAFADLLLEWLREVARPPRGIDLRSDDGTTFTGIVLVERSRVIVMLAARHTSCGCGESAPVTSLGSAQRLPLSSRYGVDPNAPGWDRDGDPFRR
jgi:hypothetical protein